MSISYFVFWKPISYKVERLGTNVIHLIDDSTLRHNEMSYANGMLKSRGFSIKEKLYSYLLKWFGLHIQYSDFISKEDLKRVTPLAEFMISKKEYMYKNVDLKTYIDGSIIRAFRSSTGYVEYESTYAEILKICTKMR